MVCCTTSCSVTVSIIKTVKSLLVVIVQYWPLPPAFIVLGYNASALRYAKEGEVGRTKKQVNGSLSTEEGKVRYRVSCAVFGPLGIMEGNGMWDGYLVGGTVLEYLVLKY